MTEKQLRNQVAKTAESYWGFKESDGSHKKIVDLYNTQKPLPRGYAVKYTDEWCATFVSAIGIQLGLSDIIFPECSCNEMIKLYKAAGRWQEKDDYVPQVGDIVMYDWQDDGNGDNKGVADHVGYVVSVEGNSLKILEGNKKQAVDYRPLEVNDKTIRGYCLPDYASKSEDTGLTMCTVSLPVLKRGMKNNYVKTMQTMLISRGFYCGASGADGSFGSETEGTLRAFQENYKLVVDGKCGSKTWTKLLSW